MEICTLPQRIEILTLIIENMGLTDLIIASEGTIVRFDCITDKLLEKIEIKMRQWAAESAIDFDQVYEEEEKK